MAMIPFVPMPLMIKPKLDYKSLDGVIINVISVAGSKHCVMTVSCHKRDTTNPALFDLIDDLMDGKEMAFHTTTWDDNSHQVKLTALLFPKGTMERVAGHPWKWVREA